MKVVASTRKLSKILRCPRKIQKHFGKDRATNIKNRIDEFHSACCLREIPYKPPARCHLLDPHNKCRFAVSINGNYRIVFEGYAKGTNGKYHLSSNKTKVTLVQILFIEDYH